MSIPVITPAPSPQSHGVLTPLSQYVKAHPILLLLFLTPGIPEYLSGSSSWAILVLNPIVFAIFVLLNAGLYTMGVILIREAVLRWRKGWASIFLLGVAYGIVEEGIALQTLFNSNAGPVGELGFYGHWAGVNWVWTTGLLLFHATISIGLPLVLFNLALPNLKGRSLISPNRQKLCLVFLVLDCIVLYGIVKYWPGWLIMIGSFALVFSLILLARRLPSNFATSLTMEPKSSRRLFITGFLFFPLILFPGWISSSTGISPFIPILVTLALAYLLVSLLRHSIGQQNNSRQKLALCIGLVAPIICFGFLTSLSLPIIVFADIGFIFFLRKLWRHYPSLHSSTGTIASGFGLGPGNVVLSSQSYAMD